MANGGLLCSKKSLAFAICLFGLFYMSFWYSARSRHSLISAGTPGYSHNAASNCLNQLLIDFNIAGVNLAAPTYVRLAQPRPISSDCDRLIARSDNETVTNFVKFEPLKPHEQVMIHHIVHRLFMNFSQRGLEIFLAGGSLLGSVRHFGHFPWDADADVMILARQKPLVRQLLIDLSANGEVRFADTDMIFGHWQIGIMCPDDRNRSAGGKPAQYHWVVHSLSQPSPVAPCRTIVDFFFGYPGFRHYTRIDHPRSFPMENVYPLTVRPYGPYLLPVPRNPDRFLAAVYGNDYESNCFFKYFHGKNYKCAGLRSIYPFVTHLRLPHNGSELTVDLLVQGPNMTALFIPAQK